MRWAGHVARMGTEELYTGFWLGDMMGRTAWKTCENNIKMGFQEVGC